MAAMPGAVIVQDHLIRPTLIGLVLAYQRWLSPWKGFACAHRLRHGGDSCSGHALRILRRGRRSMLRLRPLMRRRFARCRAASPDCLAMTEFDPTAWNDARDRAAQTRPDEKAKRRRRRRKGESWCSGTHYCDIPFCGCDGLGGGIGDGCDCSPG